MVTRVLGPFGGVLLRTLLAVWAAALGLALAAALVRLLPWLLDPRVSWGTAGVFTRGLLAVGLETACAAALPLGYALAAASFQDRGEGLACQLAGASPAWLVARTLPLCLALASVGAAAGLVWSHDATHPGGALAELIEAARRGCGAARPVSEVPGLGASWLHAPGGEPVLVMAPAAGVVVQAARAEPLADLSGAALREARITLRGPPPAVIEVREAELVLERPFARASGTPSWARALGLTGATALGALAAAAALLARLDGRRSVAAAVGAATAILPLLLLGEVERGRLAWPWLALAPPLALLPAALRLPRPPP